MNKNIMIIWATVVILICATLIFISNSKRDKVLLKLEKDIKISTKEYINDNNIKIEYNNSYIVYIDKLIDSEYLKDNENINKYCVKTVLVTAGLFGNKYTINKDCSNNELINDSIN